MNFITSKPLIIWNSFSHYLGKCQSSMQPLGLFLKLVFIVSDLICYIYRKCWVKCQLFYVLMLQKYKVWSSQAWKLKHFLLFSSRFGVKSNVTQKKKIHIHFILRKYGRQHKTFKTELKLLKILKEYQTKLVQIKKPFWIIIDISKF